MEATMSNIWYKDSTNIIDRWDMFMTIEDNTDFDRDLDMIPKVEGEVVYVNFKDRVLVSRHRNEFDCPFSDNYLQSMCGSRTGRISA